MWSVGAATLLLAIALSVSEVEVLIDGVGNCHCELGWFRGGRYCYHLQQYDKKITPLRMDRTCHWTESQLGPHVKVDLPVLRDERDHAFLQELLTVERRSSGLDIPSIMLDLSFDTQNFNRKTDYKNMKAWKWVNGETLEHKFSNWREGRPTAIEENEFVCMDKQGEWFDVPEDYYHRRLDEDKMKHYYVCQTACKKDAPNEINQSKTPPEIDNIQVLLIIVCIGGGLLALLVGISIAVCHEKRRTRKEKEEQERKDRVKRQLQMQLHPDHIDPFEEYFYKSPGCSEHVPVPNQDKKA